MKSTVVITAEELRDAALAVLLTKPSFNGKHVGAFEFVFAPDDPNPSRRIRCEVVLFETAGGARRYLAGDAAAVEDVKPEPADPGAAADLEGEKHGRK